MTDTRISCPSCGELVDGEPEELREFGEVWPPFSYYFNDYEYICTCGALLVAFGDDDGFYLELSQ